MQLGTRWAAGTTPPSTVPAALRAEIERVEAQTDAAREHGSWTLTWLEGRPVAELDLGFEVLQHPDGSVSSAPFAD